MNACGEDRVLFHLPLTSGGSGPVKIGSEPDVMPLPSAAPPPPRTWRRFMGVGEGDTGVAETEGEASTCELDGGQVIHRLF